MLLSLHCNIDESYLYVKKTEICKFRVPNNIPWCEFCLGSISKYFTKDKLNEISLDGTVFDFSVDHSPFEKEGLLDIHGYFIKKNSKQ